METKTELPSVSADASASSESAIAATSTVTSEDPSERVAEIAPATKKKAQTRRTSRTTGKRGNADTKKTAESEQTENPKVEQNTAESDSSVSARSQDPSASAEAGDESSEKQLDAGKKPTRRKNVKSGAKSDPKPAQKVNNTSTDTESAEKGSAESIDSEKAVASKTEKTKSQAVKKNARTRAGKTTAKKVADTIDTEAPVAENKSLAEASAESVISISELPLPTVSADESVANPSPESGALLELLATLPAISPLREDTFPANDIPTPEPEPAPKKEEAPETASDSPFSHRESATEIDVSGTPHDTFVFFSPRQLAEMDAKERNKSEKTPTPLPIIESVSEPPVVKANAEEKPTVIANELTEEKTEEKTIEKPQSAVLKTDTVLVPVIKEIGSTDEKQNDGAEVAEQKPEKTDSFSESPLKPELFSPEKTVLANENVVAAERKNAPKRNDPHEKNVMDKERVLEILRSVLGDIGELERRVLIEETMKKIPLTDEERADSHPTSLSNRVRSVIGSVLAEQLSSGKIIAVGKKLSLPAPASVSEEEDLANLDEGAMEISEKDFYGSHESAEHIEPSFVFASESRASEEKARPVVPLDPVPEPIPAPVVAPSADPIEAPVSAYPTVDEKTEPPVRESSVRRARVPRGERRSSSAQPASQSGITALIITEEELERVMLNALRRSSATKNDLFAVLKRIYIDPNRLSKEEETRIYGVAGNVLQKLVNRGTLQNSDGRYLQKPSQRILNPGRDPGAYSTGNVETRFITELNRQSGDFFEQFAARLLEKYFEMSNVRVDASYVVGGSDDNGIDIMIETTDWLGYKERVFVQAKKRATQPVTLKEVREFYGALCAEEGTRGVFITTSNFCMEASKMIGKIRNLIAIDKRKLFALAEHCEVGLIRDEEGRLLLDENLFLDYEV